MNIKLCKKQLFILIIILISSAFYVIYYNLELHLIVASTYDTTYSRIYALIARPLCYLSASSVISMLIILWADKKINKNACKYSRVIFVLSMILYLVLAFWNTDVLEIIGKIKIFIFAYSPIMFIIPGACLSLGISKEK